MAPELIEWEAQGPLAKEHGENQIGIWCKPIFTRVAAGASGWGQSRDKPKLSS